MLEDITPILPRPFLTAESPIWDDRRGCAFFVDIKGHALLAWDPDSGALRDWPMGQDIGFVALTEGPDLILGLKSGLALFDPEDPLIRPLGAFRPAAHMRLNDGKVAPDGSLFFGTMGDAAEPGQGSLYRLTPGLELTEVAAGYGVPNGPAFTGDGSFYHCATEARRIDFHRRRGDGWDRQVFLDLPQDGGAPDGVLLDDAGHLWCGLWGGAGLLVVDTATGARRKHAVPATYVTSMVPIGEDGRRLLITSAAAPLLRGEPGGAALEGRVFVARLTQPWTARAVRFGAT